jgi:hypothetical protein
MATRPELTGVELESEPGRGRGRGDIWERERSGVRLMAHSGRV